MCFSPEVDLVAGAVVGAVAVDALRHVRRPAQLPLALLPAAFASHQLIEALVWWALQGDVSAGIGDAAAWWYLLIAYGVLPVLVPAAILAPEPSPRRRRLLAALVAVGAGVAAWLMYAVGPGPVRTRIDGHHIAYFVGVDHDAIVVSLYVLATCGAMLLSSHRAIRAYGLINLPVIGLLAWLDQNAVVSLWCVWAAVSSVLIAVHLRRAAPSIHSGPPSQSRTGPSSDVLG